MGDKIAAVSFLRVDRVYMNEKKYFDPGSVARSFREVLKLDYSEEANRLAQEGLEMILQFDTVLASDTPRLKEINAELLRLLDTDASTQS